MPYFRIETNLPLEPDQSRELMAEASKWLADELGKPERYVMVQMVPGIALMFGGNQEPAAYVELKSIGLPESQTHPLSKLVCSFLAERLDIPPDRVYIEFIDIPRKFWGWNNSTF